MKKFYSLCLTTLLFATLAVTGCSDPDDLGNGQPTNLTKIDNDFPNAFPNTDRGIAPGTSSHKLIIENNSDAKIVIWDIMADGGLRGGSEPFLIHFKGTDLENFTIQPFQSVVFDDFVNTSPNSFAIGKWRAENSTTRPTADFIDIATKILTDFGKTYPNMPPTIKYSDWTGIHLVAMDNEENAFPYAMGNSTGIGAAFLGNTSYYGNNSQITFGYDAGNAAVTAHWSQQPNGDIIVTITN